MRVTEKHPHPKSDNRVLSLFSTGAVASMWRVALRSKKEPFARICHLELFARGYFTNREVDDE